MKSLMSDILVIVHDDGQVTVAPEQKLVRKGQPISWMIKGGSAVVYPAQAPAQAFLLEPEVAVEQVVEVPGFYCIIITTPAGKKLGAMAVLIVDP